MGIMSFIKGRSPETCPLCFRYLGNPIEPEAYYNAWSRVAATNDGKVIIAVLQHNLSEAMLERCPTDCRTPQERSDWLMRHDAHVKSLLDLIRHATMNVQLQSHPAGPRIPPPASGQRGNT